MKVIALVVLFLICERAVPLGVWGYAARLSRRTQREFIEKFGLVSFPRTILGVAMVVSGGLEYLLPSAPYLSGTIFVLALAAYVACTVRDTLRAAFR